MTFQLHGSVTYWLSRAASVMQERFNDELETLDISWSQWMVMNLVSQGLADTPAMIAASIGVNRSAVSRSLDRLQKKGLVARVPDTEDRRSTRVEITASGALMVAYMDEAAARHQQQMLEQLDRQEFEQLKRLLGKLLLSQSVDCSKWC